MDKAPLVVECKSVSFSTLVVLTRIATVLHVTGTQTGGLLLRHVSGESDLTMTPPGEGNCTPGGQDRVIKAPW